MQTSNVRGITGSRRVRRGIAAAAVTAGVAFISACGFQVQTDKVYQAGIGADERSSQVDVLGSVVVSNTEGEGVFLATMVNNNLTTADSITSISAAGAEMATTTAELPAGGTLNLAEREGGAGVPITGDDIAAGGYVKVQVQFSNAEPVTLDVPIVPATPPYEDILPSPTGSPSADAGDASASPSADASEEAAH